jgi:hypothetical protein
MGAGTLPDALDCTNFRIIQGLTRDSSFDKAAFALSDCALDPNGGRKVSVSVWMCGLIATLAFGGGYWVRLLREDDGWPDIRERPDQTWGW